MDEKLRHAERAAEAGDSPAAKARLFTEQARIGEPTPECWAGCWLEELLAEPVYGALYRVIHAESGTQQALRLYPVPTGEHAPRAKARLEWIARLRQRLEHPAIPKVFAAGSTTSPSGEERLFLREALVGGDPQTVLDLGRMAGPLPWRPVLNSARPLAAALAAVRDAGLVHAAINPRRILIDGDGTPSLVGWSAVRPLRGTDEYPSYIAQASQAIGAPYYLAPDALRGDYSTASDVYSLCAVVYRALTQHHPFMAQTAGELMRVIVEHPVPDPREFAQDLPTGLVAVLQSGMHKDPERRPTPELLAEGFAAVLDDAPLPPGLEPPRQGWLRGAWNSLRG